MSLNLPRVLCSRLEYYLVLLQGVTVLPYFRVTGLRTPDAKGPCASPSVWCGGWQSSPHIWGPLAPSLGLELGTGFLEARTPAHGLSLWWQKSVGLLASHPGWGFLFASLGGRS